MLQSVRKGVTFHHHKETCAIDRSECHVMSCLYINDFPKCLRHTTPGMFADDTYITTAHEEISTIECSLNSDLIAVHNWLQTKIELQYF